MNELRNSKSDDQLEELLLLTEQMQEELDQKDRTIRELKVQLDESLTLNELHFQFPDSPVFLVEFFLHLLRQH